MGLENNLLPQKKSQQWYTLANSAVSQTGGQIILVLATKLNTEKHMTLETNTDMASMTFYGK